MLSLAGVIQIEKFAPRQTASTGEFLDHHTSAPSALPDRQALVSPAKLLASRAILALGNAFGVRVTSCATPAPSFSPDLGRWEPFFQSVPPSGPA